MNELSSNPPQGPVQSEYLHRIRSGEIERDDAQIAAAAALDRLARDLSKSTTHNSSIFDAVRSRFQSTSAKSQSTMGLYIYGSVGTGKTMLMDLFYDLVSTQPKARSHFHEFMAETHERIAHARTRHEGDPIPYVANEIAQSTKLLCFDELHVTDIADAMILSRLFKGLFEMGVVVVATSNAHPDDLYKDGLNRQLFEPFCELVKTHMQVHQLLAAKDFRLDKLMGRKLYHTPAGQDARREMDAHWQRLTGEHRAEPVDLDVKGRKLHVPLASMGVARFSFSDLCAKPLGTLDYLRIAHEFHTVLIDGIPCMTPENRNEARRFINLIDTLYDCKVSLVASAEAKPDCLYISGDGAQLFERTASRLTEMRTEAYLGSRAQAQKPATQTNTSRGKGRT